MLLAAAALSFALGSALVALEHKDYVRQNVAKIKELPVEFRIGVWLLETDTETKAKTYQYLSPEHRQKYGLWTMPDQYWRSVAFTSIPAEEQTVENFGLLSTSPINYRTSAFARCQTDVQNRLWNSLPEECKGNSLFHLKNKSKAFDLFMEIPSKHLRIQHLSALPQDKWTEARNHLDEAEKQPIPWYKIAGGIALGITFILPPVAILIVHIGSAFGVNLMKLMDNFWKMLEHNEIIKQYNKYQAEKSISENESLSDSSVSVEISKQSFVQESLEKHKEEKEKSEDEVLSSQDLDTVHDAFEL